MRSYFSCSYQIIKPSSLLLVENLRGDNVLSYPKLSSKLVLSITCGSAELRVDEGP